MTAEILIPAFVAILVAVLVRIAFRYRRGDFDHPRHTAARSSFLPWPWVRDGSRPASLDERGMSGWDASGGGAEDGGD